MNINPTIHEAALSNNNIITSAQIRELGFSQTLISKYVKNNLLKRIRHGVYSLSAEIYDDMYTLSLSSKYIVFSHETALFLNGLSDRTPFIHSITVPSNARVSPIVSNEAKVYYINPALYTIGLTERKTTFGNSVRCYDSERTICDILRSRNRLNEETVLSAIKKYISHRDKNLGLLGIYAEKLRVINKLNQFLGVLL